MAAMLLAFVSLHGHAQPNLEHAVKATFLYKFAAFIEWPPETFASATSPLVLCLLGSDPVSRLADEAAIGQTIDAHPVVVRHLADVSRGADCHVLYVASLQEETAAGRIERLRGMPILTVTDGAREGRAGVVNFVIADNRVRFEVDLEAAALQRLTVSSKLLSLAVRVRPRS